MVDSSLSMEDTDRLIADGWIPFKPSMKSGTEEPPSLGWWWQKVYVSDACHYYGQKHLEEYTVNSLDNSGSVVIERKVMKITLDRQFPLQERKIRITNNIVEIVFVDTNANDFPKPETFRILNRFKDQNEVVQYLQNNDMSTKRKRRVNEVPEDIPQHKNTTKTQELPKKKSKFERDLAEELKERMR